jgi:hypothetical protein
MRTSKLIAGWSLILLLLPAERAAGQDKPKAFFSPTADVGSNYNPDTDANKPLRQVNLRPNQEAPFHVYVHNPLPVEAELTVQLVSGEKTNRVVAASSALLKVPSKTTVYVPLTADKAQLPPALPPTIGADGKAVAAPPPAIKLGTDPVIRVLDAKGVPQDEKATIGNISIGDLATVAAPVVEGKKLSIKVTPKTFTTENKPLGPPITVKLTPRKANGEPVAASTLAVAGNVLEGSLALSKEEDGAAELTLSVLTDGLDANGFLDVSVDGYSRAGAFKLDGTPASIFAVEAPSAAIPGKPITVRLMASDPKPKEKFAVIFKRGAGVEEVRHAPSARNEFTSVRIGANGEVVLAFRSEDWAFPFATNGLFGAKDFVARRADKTSGASTVQFDSTAPKLGEVKAEPVGSKATSEWFVPGQRIKVIATPSEGESAIDPANVLLYIGEKPGADGKAAPGGQVVQGKLEADGKAFSAEFTIPATFTATRLRAGIIATNTVGLIGGGEGEIKVDPTPPEVSKLIILPQSGKEPDFQVGVTEKEPLASFKPGDTIRLLATAIDPESQIDTSADVVFFLGDAPGPDGKDLQTTYKRYPTKQGQAGKTDADFKYAADITLPKDIKKETEVKVGVMFKNKAGLYGTRVASIKLDKDFTTATIKVKVTQGGAERLQPDIKVWLVDQFGAVAAEGKTDKCGVAVFEKVLPGTYLVWGVKDTDQNSQDYKTVVARGGDEIDVALSVKRQLAPNIQPPKPPQR